MRTTPALGTPFSFSFSCSWSFGATETSSDGWERIPLAR